MSVTDLRARMADVVRRVRSGDRVTVRYRGRPVFRLLPVEDGGVPALPLEMDPLYRAPAFGRSRGVFTARDDDATLYGDRAR